MSSSQNTPYPVVSREQVVDLFHAILGWRASDSEHRYAKDCFFTFNTCFSVLAHLGILPERRIESIRRNKEFAKLFLKKSFVIDGADASTMSQATAKADADKLLFVIRTSSNEMVSGRGIRPQEIFSRKRIYITDRGRMLASLAADRVRHLLTQEQWDAALRELRERFMPRTVMGKRRRVRNELLDEELYGYPARGHARFRKR